MNKEEKTLLTEEASLGFSAKGYIGRKKYWKSILYVFLACIPVTLVMSLFGSAGDGGAAFAGVVMVIFQLFVQVYFILQAVKRCHDLGHSGWWILIPFYDFWLLFAKGTPAPQNKYKA